ncbi:MAG: hypothetical protein QOH63_1986 [Acidobacteriota bacterium]|nr:hypothetical protein [Acidobacteriota bacterium]
MAEADMNKSGSGGSQTPPGNSAQQTGSGSAAAIQASPQSPKVQPDTLKLVVNGQEVDEKTYFEAAAKQYDVTRLREANHRPEIITK